MKKKLTINSPVTLKASAGIENPALGWLDFVLTDDKPNGNGQGISQEKFGALIDSGMYMPVKMAVGKIDDHDDAVPLGAIVSLDEVNSSQVIGKASLWKAERPNDYKALLAMSTQGTPPHISWEIIYTESIIDDSGTEWLQDPILTAATIVSNPAYQGRTPIISVASIEEEETTESVDEEEPDEEVVDEAEQSEVEEEGESEEEPTDEETSDEEESADASNDKLIEELEELRKYRAEREAEDAKKKLLKTRLDELAEAGITMSTEELESNREVWSTMSDETFAVVKELLKVKGAQASNRNVEVPDVSESNPETTIELVRKGLAEMKNK